MNSLKEYIIKLSSFFRFPVLNLILLIFFILFIGYRDVFLHNKLVFPSNYLSSFYSPWSTYEFPEWGNRIPNKPIGVDLVRFFYPGWEFAVSEVKEGRVPLWIPYVFSGNVYLANFQSAFFYPPNWLYFLFPLYNTWAVLHFLPYFIAGIFTYLYCRKINVHPVGAIFSGVSFAFSGYMITWAQENTVVPNVAAFLPVLLLITEHYVTTKKIKYLYFFSLSWAIAFFAGHFQTAFYITALAFLYFIYRTYFSNSNELKEKITSSFLYFLFFSIGVLITSIQLLPSYEAFLYSPRPSVNANETMEGFLVPFTHLIKLIVPDWEGNPGSYNYFGPVFYHETALYIGITGLITVILALLFQRRVPFVRFFALTSIITFLLTTNNSFTKFLLSLPLPLVSTFIPSRILLLTTFSLTILAGIGLSLLFTTYTRRVRIFAAAATFIFICIVGIFNVVNILHFYFTTFVQPTTPPIFSIQTFLSLFKESDFYISLKNSFLPILFLSATVCSFLFKKYIPILVILTVSILSQLWLLNKYYMPGEQEFLYHDHSVFTSLQEQMETTDRFISLGEKIQPNLFLPWKIATPEGLDPIHNYRYGQLVNSSKTKGEITTEIPRIEATLPNPDKGKSIITNQIEMKLLSLLGVNYVAYFPLKEERDGIKSIQVLPEPYFTLLKSTDGWEIFKYNMASPRAYLSDSYQVKNSYQDIVNSIFKEQPPTKVVILEESLPYELSPISDNDYVEIINYKSQEVTVETQTEGGKLLFLSDNFYPGWKAYVDSVPTKIYRANGSFRAVYTPAGRHEITFIYKPESFYWGLRITVFTLLLLGVCAFFTWKRNYFSRFLPS